jgi:hypothetical protein
MPQEQMISETPGVFETPGVLETPGVCWAKWHQWAKTGVCGSLLCRRRQLDGGRPGVGAGACSLRDAGRLRDARRLMGE